MKVKIATGLTLAALVIGLLIYTRPDVQLVSPPTANAERSTQQSQREDRTRGNALANSQMDSQPAEETPATTNLLTQLLKGGDCPRLTLEQADAFVAQRNRHVEGLLAASDSTGDRKYLNEAMEKFPNDPRVAFRAAFQASDANGDGPNETRRKWLDVFQQNAPDNALPDYLSAAEHFRAGEPGKAFAELASASKKQMDDYSQDFLLNNEEAYRNAGYSEAEAKMIASISLLLPQEAQFRSVGRSLVDLANGYRKAGDEASAQAALQMALDLGQRLNTPHSLTLIEPLVGIAIQRQAYGAMDPNAIFGNSGQTVQTYIDGLSQQRDAIKQVAQRWNTYMPRMSEPDVTAYLNRQWLYGEQAASRWMAGRLGLQ